MGEKAVIGAKIILFAIACLNSCYGGAHKWEVPHSRWDDEDAFTKNFQLPYSQIISL